MASGGTRKAQETTGTVFAFSMRLWLGHYTAVRLKWKISPLPQSRTQAVGATLQRAKSGVPRSACGDVLLSWRKTAQYAVVQILAQFGASWRLPNCFWVVCHLTELSQTNCPYLVRYLGRAPDSCWAADSCVSRLSFAKPRSVAMKRSTIGAINFAGSLVVWPVSRSSTFA